MIEERCQTHETGVPQTSTITLARAASSLPNMLTPFTPTITSLGSSPDTAAGPSSSTAVTAIKKKWAYQK